MNLKSTAQSVLIFMSEKERCGFWSLAESCLGSLLGAFSTELQGKVRACCKAREIEEGEIEGTISFAHQTPDYFAA